MAGTRPEMAWPHVEQNAVVEEISLPHFEQYTGSPFCAFRQPCADCGNPTSPFSVGQSPVAPKIPHPPRSPFNAEGILGQHVELPKSPSFRVATTSPWILAVAAIIASSSRRSCLPSIRRAHSRKQAASMDKIWVVAASRSTQDSISSALIRFWSRVRSIPRCNSPNVTAERKICSSCSSFNQASTPP